MQSVDAHIARENGAKPTTVAYTEIITEWTTNNMHGMFLLCEQEVYA